MSRRKIIFSWCAFAFAAGFFLLLQSALLNRLHIWGVHPFLPPCIAAIAATYSSRRGGLVFALVLGLCCDLTIAGTFPLYYSLVLTLCALGAGIISRRFMQPGFTCSMVVSIVSLLLSGLFHLLVLSGSNLSTGGAAFLMFREILLTLPGAVLIFFAYMQLSRFLADV